MLPYKMWFQKKAAIMV